MRMMFVIFITLFLGLNYYVFYRLYHLLPAGLFLRPLLVMAGLFLVSSFFFGLLLAGKITTPLASFLHAIGTSWFFILIYLCIVFLLFDLLRVTRLLPVENWMYENWRVFVGLTLAIGVIFSLGYVRYRNKERVELDLVLPEGKVMDRTVKILAASDLHLGYGVGKKEFSKWVDLINAENPDVVLLAGDIFDNTVRPLSEQNYEAVFHRIRSTYGVYAAPGNHEYISGLPDALSFLERSGVTVLRDSGILVDSLFYIVGRDDRMNPDRKSIAELSAGMDRTKPVILLDHQPYNLEEPEENGVTLQISGHTHRGQIWPISWMTDALYEISHGYKKKGDTHIYVSSGIGLWGGKFRIGTRSEYVVIFLHE